MSSIDPNNERPYMDFQSDRRFQIWDYHVSHARLLIRSPHSSNIPTNNDIIFYGVVFIGIPAFFHGLKIASISREEGALAGVPFGEHDHSSTAFRLDSEGRSWYLVALSCRILENDLDLFDSSLENPVAERPREDLGRVLAHS
jgi:hypothetical protein